ncbi:uncharacterized protein LOC110847086 [Folsomia candida]|uniref:Enoyl-CoA delta isomerase 2, mitochondrial n=1 Tax=Folsomia candida TaxID=158441 RepID=A0A226EI01_FOLCA|nr:uncharacterized protein LOC110847086 [Folsomia candida]OXA56674.1 Enoyl-CoA delta isomerase 2, mitochondrial [Folsomia candida]
MNRLAALLRRNVAICGPSIRSSELLNSNSKWDQIGKSFYSAEFGPRSKPRRFGIDPNRDHSKLNPHEPPVFLKPGETPDDFEVVCYKLHFIRINNLGYRLKLAALYSQATIGPNTNPDPPKDDHYEHSYWTAWKQLGNMSKDEARKEYIQTGKMRMEKKDPDIVINL